MLTSLRTKTAIAVVALAALLTVIFAVRATRRLSPPPVAAESEVEADPAARETGAGRDAAPDAGKAPAPTTRTEVTAARKSEPAKETATAKVDVRGSGDTAAPVAATRDTSAPDVAAKSVRPVPMIPPTVPPTVQPKAENAASVVAARPTAEVAATVAAKGEPRAAVTFDDRRNFDLAQLPKPATREAGESVAQRPTPATGRLFEDRRPPLAISAPAARSATAEQPSNVAERASTAAGPEAAKRAGPEIRPPAPGPNFNDQRGLIEPATATNPRSADRRDDAVRTQPQPSAPSFIDQRQPIGAPAARAAPDNDPVGPGSRGSSPQNNVGQDRLANASVDRNSARPSAAVAPTGRSPAACEPAQIASEPLDGGRMLVRVATPCRADQTVHFGYGEATILGRLDGGGRLELTLDLFAGAASPVEITFEDGVSREIPARANDLDKVEKIALIWRAPVDLDLHAFEYGATFGQPGHVWAQAPSSAMAARDQTATNKRGRGFISRADGGQGPGDKIEIYTFFRHPEQAAGLVSIAVDYATRGDLPAGTTCGSGPQAEVRFETVVTARGRVARESGVLASVPCGKAMSADARFGIMHQIRVNR